MAILKTIEIHDSGGVANAEKYIEDQDKSTLSQDVINELEYDMNEKKTETPEKRLVSGYRCTPNVAAHEFQWARDRYRNRHPRTNYKKGKKDVEALHVVMSFEHIEGLDPELVHEMGLEFVQMLEEAVPGQHMAVVSTHLNTAHLHNHILINSYSEDGLSKIYSNKEMLKLMRDINDEISIRHGLPVLSPDKSVDRLRSEKMGERVARMEGRSWKEEFRQDIDAVIDTADNYEDWKQQMRELGYSIREKNDGTPISMSYEGHCCRLDKLGEEWTYKSIIEKIARNNGVDPALIKPRPPKVPRVYMERVSRYTEDGRRRSNIEMLILRVISYLKNMIKLFLIKGLLEEASKAQKQIDAMQKMLDLMDKYGVTTQSSLRKLEKDCGRNIKQLNGQLIITEKTIQDIQTHIANGTLPSTMAEIDPMSPRQKQQLYKALENSDYRCYCKYDKISATEADHIIDYITNGGIERPGTLVRGYTPVIATPVLMQNALQNAENRLRAVQRELDEQKHRYKDYKFLENAIQEAERLQEEARTWNNDDMPEISDPPKPIEPDPMPAQKIRPYPTPAVENTPIPTKPQPSDREPNRISGFKKQHNDDKPNDSSKNITIDR